MVWKVLFCNLISYWLLNVFCLKNMGVQVLDMHAYEDRQKEYAMDGHKHFYFMTLNGSEVWQSEISSLLL